MFDELVRSITDWHVFTDSVAAYFQNFSLSNLVMTILATFSVVGLIDKLRGNKNGYGEKFDEGFGAMGPLALAVVGIVSLSPVLLVVLGPIVTPVYRMLGASPAMFPASLLALDMGGYALSTQLAGADVAVGQYAGIIVASMMGMTMCFTIPYALTMMKKEDHPILAMGILIGVVTLPLGCLAGGLAMYTTSTPLSMLELLRNTLPVLLLAAVVVIGLMVAQQATMRAFTGFGKGITMIIVISPVIAIFQYLTGLRLPLFDRMVEPDPVLGGVPLLIGLLLVGQIAIVLTGAFPMIHFLNRRFGHFMSKFGAKVGINNEASTGLLTQLASSIPVWSVIDGMNTRGKLLNVAFAVSGSFVFGDALAFTGGTAPEMVFPMIVAKLTAGVTAVALAIWLQRKGKLKGI